MLLTVKARCFVGVTTFTIALSGCGNDCPSAPTNTPPTPTVTGLWIGGNVDRLRTRQTQALTATVTLSNGTTQAATSPSWSSNNATVASVSDGGVVRQQPGQRNHFCDSSGPDCHGTGVGLAGLSGHVGWHVPDSRVHRDRHPWRLGRVVYARRIQHGATAPNPVDVNPAEWVDR